METFLEAKNVDSRGRVEVISKRLRTQLPGQRGPNKTKQNMEMFRYPLDKAPCWISDVWGLLGGMSERAANWWFADWWFADWWFAVLPSVQQFFWSDN